MSERLHNLTEDGTNDTSSWIVLNTIRHPPWEIPISITDYFYASFPSLSAAHIH
jgi:hypothetical protein